MPEIDFRKSQLSRCLYSKDEGYSLEAEDQASIGSQAHFLHDIFKGNEIFDVEVRLVAEVFGGGIKVDVEA